MFIACSLGLVPDRYAAVLAGRKSLCESLAVHSSLCAQKNDLAAIEAGLKAALDRNSEIRSIGLRRDDGSLTVNLGDHAEQWEPLSGLVSTETQLCVPIRHGDDLVFTLELFFAPIDVSIFSANSLTGFLLFFGTLTFAAFFCFLRPLFKSLGGGGAVPQRVKAAMNMLAEGVLILDKNERIAMANNAFSQLVGVSGEKLLGQKVNDLNFSGEADGGGEPWTKSVQDGETQRGVLMDLKKDKSPSQRVSINSAPIYGEDGKKRGALATFDNLTVLERKHDQLRKVLRRLRASRKVVRKQNIDLKALATRDPMTGCYNRRSLFTEFEKNWEASKRFQRPLSCLMIDVDHFKAVNDNHGHAVGDEVLKAVANILRKTARKSDVVSRYGGEEFCILLPNNEIGEAEQAAERFRRAIEHEPLAGVSVTASIGASALSLGAKHPQELMEQADKALYAAKRSGRNRSVRFDCAPKELLEAKRDVKKPAEKTDTPVSPDLASESGPIPFQAVGGLVAALGYRHAETADHCRRVADLCVTTAPGLMSQREVYVVEMAALLHDIGKLGVPDAVLLKAGPLTPDEWKVVKMHEQIGVEIIRAAFASDELTEIVRLQHCSYGGTPTDVGLPRGQKIPLGARLLAVANAFDSMISEHNYRTSIPGDQAFAELRRCSGTQFDPIVVEHFIAALQNPASHENSTVTEPMAISKKTALKIGVQIEKLAMAADVKDLATLGTMAGQLKTMAVENGIANIADVAGRLEVSAASNSNHVDLMELTIDLLELCRKTQRSILPANSRPKKARPKSKANIELKIG